MKKLMVALATVVTAAAVQAASVDWSVANSSWTLNNNTKAEAGYTVYLINGATALDTIAKAIDDKTGAFNSDQTWVFGSSTTANARGAVAKSTTTTEKLTQGTSYDFSVLIIDATNTSDIRYMVSGISTQMAYKVGDDEAASVSFGATHLGVNALTYDSTNAANGWVAVPEPTSGLLLLIGVAGLALKRKRM